MARGTTSHAPYGSGTTEADKKSECGWVRGMAADPNGRLSTKLREPGRIRACGGGSVPEESLPRYFKDP
ncbi:hypothetical protein NDU88_006293 [Pleurodeles waltl]|uniref:Uncharacterized protein n=1 Tax=Pleurodeles waltl TaxID=8319 RepID=A0AAV7MBT6_PLEWA|nr:hypothetical protein NDU88_006293 [Pleurodeles waltl]